MSNGLSGVGRDVTVGTEVDDRGSKNGEVALSSVAILIWWMQFECSSKRSRCLQCKWGRGSQRWQCRRASNGNLPIWISWEGWRVRKRTDSQTRMQKRRMKSKEHLLLQKYCKPICRLHSGVIVCLMHAKHRRLAVCQRSVSVTCVYIWHTGGVQLLWCKLPKRIRWCTDSKLQCSLRVYMVAGVWCYI